MIFYLFMVVVREEEFPGEQAPRNSATAGTVGLALLSKGEKVKVALLSRGDDKEGGAGRLRRSLLERESVL